MPRFVTLNQILRSAILKREIELENRSAHHDWGLDKLIIEDFEVYGATISRSHDPFTNRETVKHHDSPIVYHLRDITFNPSLGTIGHKGHRIQDSVPRDLQRPNSWDSSRIPRPSTKIATVTTALRLRTNYYHFIAEDLPRIALLKHHVNLEALYTQSGPFPAFIRDALKILEIHQIGVRQPVRFESIFYVGQMDGDFWPSPTALEVTRKSLLKDEASSLEPQSRIYLSRRKATRSVRGEDQIEKFLLDIGFEVVYAEELSLEEQLRVFSNCHTLIGPHGAGLTNSVFMPAGGQVIEIMSKNWAIPVFERVAGTRLSYSRILIDTDSDVKKVISALAESLGRK